MAAQVRGRRAGGGFTLLIAAWASAAAAGPLERLVMPGPLAAAHAELEGECGRCHSPFERAAERGLCLACHEGVADDQRQHRGFHGLHPAAAADCRTCHADHRGRTADLLGLQPAGFDHALTDAPLHGAHVGVACDACHPPGRPHREAPHDCAACHREDDPHRGAMGPACADCHAETGWQQARFAHADTGFALDGGHAGVACAVCHPDARYRDTPRDCAPCHALDDPHRGRFGARCEQCHETGAWDRRSFDHGRDTRFPLAGGHGGVACETCHAGGLFARKLATDCGSCHRGDDVHGGRNGSRCGDCHGPAGWTPARFDHAARTRFPLRGAHAPLACAACHTRPVDEAPLGGDCVACHRADDAHRGEQGSDCARCHGEAGWRQQVRFDHDLARFPLLGMHAVTACEGCHATPAFRDAEPSCRACHGGDDRHEGRLGEACESCHNPNAWAAWRFDHAVQTGFALAGAHQRLACESCHRNTPPPGTAPVAPAADCVACHAADDPHGDAFGRDCQRCHGDGDWREVRLAR